MIIYRYVVSVPKFLFAYSISHIRSAQVLEELRGQMRLLVWASRSVVDQIGEVKVSGANTGIGNVLANKGAIVATIECKKTIISSGHPAR